MSSLAGQNDIELAKANVPSATAQGLPSENPAGVDTMDVDKDTAPLPGYSSSSADEEDYEDKPTEEEMRTLPRVSGQLKWSVWTIAFAELCERFSYYGSAVLYTNFVQHPLPMNSTTGAVVMASVDGSQEVPGALGMGQRASTALGLFNQFFAYLMPLVGAYIADAKLGRYVTVHIAIAISTVAHVVLTAGSAPSVITKPNSALGAFIIGLLTLCVGTGFFKANISPLLAEQNQERRPRVEVRNGQRVIVDPSMTNARIFLYFYFAINVGAVAGQISMVWVERIVGFWLAFLLPTILFLCAPVVLWSQKKKYVLSPPTGSVLSKFLKMFFYTVKKSGVFRSVNWDYARPSKVPIAERPSWMTYDDAWVDEVRRGLKACQAFLFLPIFHLAYNQMTGNLTSQASSMQLHGVPNDIIQNLNPLSIIIMVPIMDKLVYPGLARLGIAFTPIKRMAVGFFFGAFSMVAAAVMQHYIYKMSPCGENATTCDQPAPINVWAQSLPYILIGISEIFTNVTSYEYAFWKAPENMKSLVMSVNLFMSAVSAAIGQAFVPLSEDPLLVWNYTTIAVIAFLGGTGFWLCFRHLDSEEDKWNMIKASQFQGKVQPNSLAVEDVNAAAEKKVDEKA